MKKILTLILLLPTLLHAQENIIVECFVLNSDMEQMDHCSILVYEDGVLTEKIRSGYMNTSLEPDKNYRFVATKRGYVSKAVNFATGHASQEVVFPMAIVLNYSADEFEEEVLQVGSLYFDEQLNEVKYEILE